MKQKKQPARRSRRTSLSIHTVSAITIRLDALSDAIKKLEKKLDESLPKKNYETNNLGQVFTGQRWETPPPGTIYNPATNNFIPDPDDPDRFIKYFNYRMSDQDSIRDKLNELEDLSTSEFSEVAAIANRELDHLKRSFRVKNI